jgi:hypothetical protein
MTTQPLTSIQELTVEIGETPILLRCQDEGFWEIVRQRYSAFVGEGTEPACTFDVEVVRPEVSLSHEGELRVWREGGLWRLERGDFRVEWDSRTRRGHILQTLTPYAIDTALRIVHTIVQAPEGGFLLHGASAIRNGRAFLFSGVSGAGKTTISSLAPKDAILLTDEISYIRRDGAGYRAYGTPFAGELARPGENATAPIEALYFLAKGPKNAIEPIPTADALRMLLRNILFFADDPELVKMVFRSANEFLGQVPAYRLTFYPDGRVWDLIA